MLGVRKKTLADKIRELFSRSGDTEKFIEDLEDILIEADINASVTMEISEKLMEIVKENKIKDSEVVRDELKKLLSECVQTDSLILNPEKMNIFMVLGVNGVGKTTSVAKLAHYYKKQINNDNIIIAAADTFRAAAIEQLQLHGERLGLKVIKHQQGADPGAVVFDAITSAKASGSPLVVVDTAGQMHNKEHLVKELQKINKIISGQLDSANYKKILVIDATTGQNGFSQAETFHQAVGIDAIILTKYDSMSKGGNAITIGKKLGIPVVFIGTGEKYDDFLVFNKDSFLENIIGI